MVLHEALGVPQLSVCIDDLFAGLEPFFTSFTEHVVERHFRYSEIGTDNRLITNKLSKIWTYQNEINVQT